MLSPKPKTCHGCSLYLKGHGFAEPVGPKNSDLLIVGESLGAKEAFLSKPFVGPSGMYLEKILRLSGLDRDSIRIANVVSCQPPGDKLDGTPWEKDAIGHCYQYLAPVLSEPHKSIVTLGAVATRTVLGIAKHDYKANNWHGTLNKWNEKVVVPTFHPAFLLRGNQKLTGAMVFAFKQAMKYRSGYSQTYTHLMMDPPVAQFKQWADKYNPEFWLAVDIETNDKIGSAEDEISPADSQIIRINFSYNPGEGITVPFSGAYLPIIRQLLLTPGVKCLWNASYDIPRLVSQGYVVSGQILDFMWAWHILQSDLPRGLGFVAPFYSDFGAWKHLADTDAASYAAIDAVQTIRCAFGIAKDLQETGQWEAFYRHVYELDTAVLQPATTIGLKVDKNALTEFGYKLDGHVKTIFTTLEGLYPKDILPLFPKDGWKSEKPLVNYPNDPHIKKAVIQVVKVCTTCGEIEVSIKHRCKDKSLTPHVVEQEESVDRYFVTETFNPNSTAQIGSYITFKGLDTGTTESGKVATDKTALESLAKKDKFFKELLAYRKVEKVKSTYVDPLLGTETKQSKLDIYDRIHAQFLFKPSTMRLSCINPNLTNVIQDKKESISSGFRKCIVPSPGCVLIEVDYSGIEAVLTGWFMGDPDYMRLARLGVHAYVTSHLVKSPADLTWSDQQLKDHFQAIKNTYPLEYDKAKRVVHGTNYGLTEYGMVNYYPGVFTRASAKSLQELYFALCPKLKPWQENLRERARRDHYLGGPDHPFHYKHWFWDVKRWNGKKKVLDHEGKEKWIDNYVDGSDINRVVSYYPQSTAAGILKDSCLNLATPGHKNYIGDMGWNYLNPFRALIHDSMLLDVLSKDEDMVINRVVAEMTKPLPQFWTKDGTLSIGVEVKRGKNNWQEMEVVHGIKVEDTAMVEDEE